MQDGQFYTIRVSTIPSKTTNGHILNKIDTFDSRHVGFYFNQAVPVLATGLVALQSVTMETEIQVTPNSRKKHGNYKITAQRPKILKKQTEIHKGM